MAQQRASAANQARQNATNAIVGGVGKLAGIGAQGAFGGSEDGFMANLGMPQN